ncbi:GAF domain-containing protein [bacterium]|nr:GAF domain-containing protein [bacterium]
MELITELRSARRKVKELENFQQLITDELEELREREERFRSISENIPGVVFMYIVDSEGIDRQSLYTGPGFEDIVGQDQVDQIGDDVNLFFSMIPPEDQERMEQASLEAEAQGHSLDLEYRLQLSPTKMKWVRSISRPIKLENGFIRWQGVLFDIDEHKRDEAIRHFASKVTEAITSSNDIRSLIRKIHQHLGTLLEASNFFVALYDDTIRLYSFPYYQDEYDELEEYEPIPLKDSLTDYVRRTGKPLLVREKEIEELDRRGEIRLFGTNTKVWMGAPLIAEDKVIGVVVLQDYSDEMRYTEQDLELLHFVAGHIAVAVERKRALESARDTENLKIAQELARTVAHEFRQPLASLMLICDLLEHESTAEKARVEMTRRIPRAVQRIEELVSRLFRITKIESKPYAMGLDIVDLEKSTDDRSQ